jgi:hypothetical protein
MFAARYPFSVVGDVEFLKEPVLYRCVHWLGLHVF